MLLSSDVHQHVASLHHLVMVVTKRGGSKKGVRGVRERKSGDRGEGQEIPILQKQRI